jgi:hypothetical protein
MSWTPLCGNDEPPFRGSPDALDGAVGSMRTIATTLKDQANVLQGYMNDTGAWTGIAKDACVKSVGGLPPQLWDAHDKYSNAANALGPYSSTLRWAIGQAETLRGQAEDAQNRIIRFGGALHDQQHWEQVEQTRAHNAQTDPILGSPVAAAWPGHNNAALLAQAKSDLQAARHALDGVRSSVHDAGINARNGINAAAALLKDDGGLKGWTEHRVADIKADAKKVVAFASAHGFDLVAFSETLSALSGWLGIASLIPIPFVQEVLAVLSKGVAVLSLAVGLTLALAGQESWSKFGKEALFAAVPFAASGLRARAVVGEAEKLGGSSSIARNLYNVSADERALVKNAKTIAKSADQFKVGAFKNQAINAAKIFGERGPATSLKLTTLGTRPLTGIVASNSATKILKMSFSGFQGKAGGVLAVVGKGHDYKERYDSAVVLKNDVPDLGHNGSNLIRKLAVKL